MKILHTAALLTPPAGILNQMEWEQEAAHQLGLDWQVRMFCPAGSVKEGEVIHLSKKIQNCNGKGKSRKAINWLVLRWEYHRWLKSLEATVDIFLLRHYVHDPFQLLFIARCKKPVYLVHHTLEVHELTLADGFSGSIRAVLEGLIGKYCIRQSNLTIGVTQEIIDYERKRALQPDKPSLLYPNGITYSGKTVADKRTDVPELLFVASYFEPWHGLDLLISSMQKNQDKFILHLIGDISTEDIKMAQKDKRIVFHGRKSHQEIQEIAATCWLGLSSFALFRNNMSEACTLKVREYLMMGIPVYAGYIEVFPKSFKYYKNELLSIESILNFCRKIRYVERDEVALQAKPFIDKEILLGKLFNNLSSLKIS